MNRIKVRSALVVTLTVAVLASVSACSSTPAAAPSATKKSVDYGLVNPGTITATITAGDAPFGTTDASGKPVGFLIDLTDRVGKDLGLQVQYKETDVNGGLAGLTSGSYDLMAVGLVETPDRAAQVGFTKPIFWGQNAVLVRTGSKVKTVKDLTGLRVGAGAASQQLDYANESLTKSTVVTEAASAAGVNQLLNGNLDAFIIGGTHVPDLQKENPGKLKVAFATDQPQPGALAINKKLTKFKAAYNTELGKLVDNGTFLKLYNKWFDTKATPYPTSMYKYWPGLKKQVEAQEKKSK